MRIAPESAFGIARVRLGDARWPRGSWLGPRADCPCQAGLAPACSSELAPLPMRVHTVDVDLWERSREIDRRWLGWIWDDDGNPRWWVWLIAAAILLTSAVWDLALGRIGTAVAGSVIVVWFVASALVRRRKRPSGSGE